MVNTKIKSETPEKILVQYEMCEMEQQISHHEAELNHNKSMHDINVSRHMTSQYAAIAEHFEEDFYHGCESNFITVNGDSIYYNVHPAARDCINQSALHLAVKYNCWEMLDQQLSRGANVNAEDLYGYTPLHVAATCGNAKMAEVLLQHGACPNVRALDGFRPLYLAVQAGEADTIEVLAKYGCDVHETIVNNNINRKYSYLHIAVEMNNIKMVEALLKSKVDVNVRDSYGHTNLHFTSRLGRLEMTRLLLTYGARVHERDNSGQTALYFAVDNGHKDVFQLLLNYGASLTDCGMGGIPLLHVAIMNGNIKFVKILLSKGIDINAVTRFDQSPLHCAIIGRNWEALDILLEHGANVNCRDWYGKTPLHTAVEYKRKGAYDVLLRHGADVNARDPQQQTALHTAVHQGCQDTVELLLHYGADVNACDDNQQTVLHVAVQCRRRHLFNTLIRQQVDIEARDSKGMTPLHLAVLCESWNLTAPKPEHTFFAHLLQRGANAEARVGGTGETVLHLACRERNNAFVRMLLHHNVELNVAEKSRGKTPLHVATENPVYEIIELLLAFGADVEKRDLCGKRPIDLDMDDVAELVYTRHCVRRSAAGLPVNSELARRIGKQEVNKNCEDEVRRMKEARLFEDVTYYDFLRGTRRSLVSFVKRPEVRLAFERERHTSKFPLYAEMLERNYVLGKYYQPLMDGAIERISIVYGHQMPIVPLEKIIGFLDHKDMRGLINAYPLHKMRRMSNDDE